MTRLMATEMLATLHSSIPGVSMHNPAACTTVFTAATVFAAACGAAADRGAVAGPDTAAAWGAAAACGAAAAPGAAAGPGAAAAPRAAVGPGAAATSPPKRAAPAAVRLLWGRARSSRLVSCAQERALCSHAETKTLFPLQRPADSIFACALNPRSYAGLSPTRSRSSPPAALS
jgi:hypothetical protein